MEAKNVFELGRVLCELETDDESEERWKPEGGCDECEKGLCYSKVAVVTDDGIGKYIPGPGCPKKNTAVKPPIGPKPYYVWIAERIRELAAAIDENAARSYNHVKVWALEIAMLKDMEKAMNEARKED